MMDRKPYQIAALDTLTRFARRAAEIGPHRAFAEIARHEPAYRDQGFGATPYLCLRLPTGGGKTVLAADAIPVLRQFAGQDYPVTLWLVPSQAILDQTAATLRDPQHPYRERLNAQFGIDRVRVLSLEDATGILPQEVRQKALILVSTTQALRVDKMDTRKVYTGHEGLDATFERLTAVPDMDTDEQGRVLASFVSLCRAWLPLVIVDEAHNARTPLSFDTLKRFAPAFILELTATPATDSKSGSNVLVRVSARELRDATMINFQHATARPMTATGATTARPPRARSTRTRPGIWAFPTPGSARCRNAPWASNGIGDTRLLVMEYKGGYLEPFDSRKRQMGLAWQRAMNGPGVFLWIGDSAETSRGRSIAQQRQEGLRGGWAAHTMPSGRRGLGSGG